jgi:hypothetical protein
MGNENNTLYTNTPLKLSTNQRNIILLVNADVETNQNACTLTTVSLQGSLRILSNDNAYVFTRR